MDEKRNRVSLPDKFERRLAQHEVLLSFYDDEYALAFRTWWEDEGKELFQAFCGDDDE